jgi:hypothetical protein
VNEYFGENDDRSMPRQSCPSKEAKHVLASNVTSAGALLKGKMQLRDLAVHLSIPVDDDAPKERVLNVLDCGLLQGATGAGGQIAVRCRVTQKCGHCRWEPRIHHIYRSNDHRSVRRLALCSCSCSTDTESCGGRLGWCSAIPPSPLSNLPIMGS